VPATTHDATAIGADASAAVTTTGGVLEETAGLAAGAASTDFALAFLPPNRKENSPMRLALVRVTHLSPLVHPTPKNYAPESRRQTRHTITLLENTLSAQFRIMWRLFEHQGA